ncbi:MAG: riboflavin synthase [Deltaproteobacteria bacterium]|nr:riboflavin synthase [Deltaproteobacteria bacterium]
MFTGLIESTGKIWNLKKRDKGLELYIEDHFVASNVKEGDSVSVDGACLTVNGINDKIVSFDVSFETIHRTIISDYKVGSIVNCELSLRADKRIGGHIVTGHVDTVGIVKRCSLKGDFLLLSINFDKDYSPFVVEKGSIAINGVSLTINEVGSDFVTLLLIPQTIQRTNLRFMKPNDRVNIEFDIIGKYVVKYLAARDTSDSRLKRLLEEEEL